MPRLYADEDFSSPVIQRLRQLAHDILTAHEAGQASQGITDAAVVALAMTYVGVVGSVRRSSRHSAKT